jgi:O-antigen ligase/tetratricopeptide (TPR) repeat protein
MQNFDSSTSNNREPTRFFSDVVLVVFMCLVAGLPWILGGNYPFVRTGSLLVLSILVIPVVFLEPRRSILNLPAVILLLAILFGIAQTDLFPALQFKNDLGIASTCQSETRGRIAELFIPLLAVVISAKLIAGASRIEWIFGILFLNGVALSFFGIAQRLAWTGRVYWFYELTNGGLPFGPFVNRNNAGGYLLMCLGAAFFFLSRRIFRQGRADTLHTNWTAVGQKKSFWSMPQRLFEFIGERFARAETGTLYEVAGLTLVLVGVAASLSRGAFAGLILSGLVGLIILLRSNWYSLFVGFVVVIMGIGVALWAEQYDSIQSRVETMVDISDSAQPRFQHWQDAWPYVQQYWQFGSGLGTYRLMYPPFQTTHFARWFHHAENQYFEALAESGVVGLSLLLLGIFCVLIGSIRLFLMRDTTSRSVGVAGLVVISGQAVSSLFDYGLFLPANNVLLATMVGMIIGRLRHIKEMSHVGERPIPVILPMGMNLVFGFGIVVGAIWSAREYSAVDSQQLASRWIEAAEKEIDSGELGRCTQLLDYAVKIRPDDPFVYYDKGRLNNLQYRFIQFALATAAAKEASVLAAAAANTKALTGDLAGTKPPAAVTELDPQTQRQQLWDGTSLLGYHREVLFAAEHNPKYFQALSELDEVKEYLVPAARDFYRAVKLAPMVARFQFELAQLGPVRGDSIADQQQRIKLAEKLCPQDSELLFNLGVLLQNLGFTTEACDYWSRCLKLTRKFESAIITVCRSEVTVGNFLQRVLPNDPNVLLRISEKYFKGPEDSLLNSALLAHTKRVVDTATVDDAVRSYWLGEIARKSGESGLAVSELQKAVLIDPANITWRMSLALAMWDNDQFDEAIQELLHCQFDSPESATNINRMIRQIQRAKSRARDSKEVRPPTSSESMKSSSR